MAGEESIVTVIDRLVDFVRLRKRTGVGEAARALGMTPGHVEKLARLLEDSGLIEVHYTFTGTELVAAQGPRKEEKKRKEERREGAAEASRKVESWVKESGKVFEFVEEDVLKKMAAAEALLARLEKEKLGEADRKTVARELSEVMDALESFERALARLSERESEFRKRIAEFRKRVQETRGKKPVISIPVIGFGKALAGIRSFVAPREKKKEERLKKVLERLSSVKRR